MAGSRIVPPLSELSRRSGKVELAGLFTNRNINGINLTGLGKDLSGDAIVFALILGRAGQKIILGLHFPERKIFLEKFASIPGVFPDRFVFAEVVGLDQLLHNVLELRSGKIDRPGVFAPMAVGVGDARGVGKKLIHADDLRKAGGFGFSSPIFDDRSVLPLK